MRSLTQIAGAALCLFTAVLSAVPAAAQEPPTSQPDADSGAPPMPPPGPFGGGPGRGWWGGGLGGMSQDERAALDDFTRQHMKNLYQLLSEAPRGGRRRQLVVFAMVRMRSWQKVQDDPELAEKVLKSVEAEDLLFQYVLDYQKASPEQQSAIRDKLRAKMREIIETFLTERAHRIERLRAKLDAEQKTLETDRANRDQLVERRIEQFLGEFRAPEDGEPGSDGGDNAMGPPPQRPLWGRERR